MFDLCESHDLLASRSYRYSSSMSDRFLFVFNEPYEIPSAIVVIMIQLARITDHLDGFLLGKFVLR